MRLVWIFLVTGLVAVRAQQPTTASPAGETRFTLELSDGSRIIGVPAIRDLKMATSYASLDIPLSKLRTIKLTGSDNVAEADFVNGDVLRGNLDATKIALTTVFGQVAVPMAEVRTIEVTVTGDKAFPAGLVLHYEFATDGGEKVHDTSGNGNDGRLQGGSFTSEGKPAGAISFNGDHQGMVIGNPESLRLQNLTIVAWVKRTNLNQVNGIASEGGFLFGYGEGGYMLAIHPNGRLVFGRCGLVDWVVAKCGIHDNLFHQIAVTRDGSHTVFYLDGEDYTADDYNPGFEFTTDAGMGARPDNLNNSFIGLIGELEVFNRPLTGDEIKGIYDSQK